MLALSDVIYCRMFGGDRQYPKVPSPKDLDDYVRPIPSRDPVDLADLRQAVIRCLLDAVVVGGIVFFSSLVGIGWGNFLDVAWISLLSAMVTVGLNFFTSLRKYLSGGGI